MVCILAVECMLVTGLSHPWLHARAYTVSIIFFFVALVFFGRDRLRAMDVDGLRIHAEMAAGHLCAIALLGGLNVYLLHFAVPGSGMERCAVWAWCGTMGLLPLTLGMAMFGVRGFVRLLLGLGDAWGIAAVCAAVMVVSRYLLLHAWDTQTSRFGQAMQVGTFRGVKALLGLVCSGVMANATTSVIGTKAFEVEISGKCSGVEGLALILGLTVGWLVYARRELRLERAVLLVPVSLTMMWLLNVLRIAVLIGIGNAGYPMVAAGGFHSVAGWMVFSCVGLGFLLVVNRVAWFRVGVEDTAGSGVVDAGAVQSVAVETNLAAVYLLPFLAIVAAGMVAGAASDGFEWLYGLRLLAALGVLYAYRSEYRRMDWRFGWLGPAAGIAVFVMWIALDRWMGAGPIHGEVVLTGVGAGLARLGAGQRIAWIAVRTVAAVVTVPIAEELAFRGYIARRIMSADVESVGYGGLSLVAVAGSSVAFGFLHGRMWLAGVLAGVVFAVVARVRGRLGEAVAAHAVANLLIAVWVLVRGDYSLW